MWFSDVAPDGTLIVAGQVLKQMIYPILFGIFGSTYNTGGEAADEFRLADPLGRSPFFKGTNADVNALSDTDGLAVASRSPKHSTTGSVGSHTHGAGTLAISTNAVTTGTGTGAGGGIGGGTVFPAATPETISGATAAATPTFSGIGGTRPNDLVPWFVCNLIIVAG